MARPPPSRRGEQTSSLGGFADIIWRAGATNLADQKELEMMLFCPSLAPRNLSLCNMFFFGGKKKNLH